MSEPAGTLLPDLIVDRISAALTAQFGQHEPGHCVRVDNLRQGDAERLVRALRRDLTVGQADVHVLVDRPEQADDDLLIPAERAVELRNRKRRQLVLLVPVGTGAAASSLDNSFERQDVVDLLREASTALVSELPDEDGLRAGLSKIAKVLGARRPVEAWARYVAEVSLAPDWHTIGAVLPVVGLIPDLGGPELVDRLARNSECVKEITRPARAVAPVADRLSKARLTDSPVRTRLFDFLSSPQRDLSNPGTWTAELAAESGLTFEHWPLTEPETVAVDQIRVEPFLRVNGTVVRNSRLKQDQVGDLPYTEAGEDTPGVVRVSWKTVPANTDAISRWQIEVLPPKDMRGDEEDFEPKAKMTIAGARRTATVTIDLDEADLEQGSLFVVRVTGLDAAGQPVLLQTGDNEIASDESQQFTVRWEADLIAGDTRRASAWALALGKLDAVLGGQDDLTEDAYSLNDTHSAVSLRLGGRRTVLLGVSPALVKLQRDLFEQGNPVTAFTASGRMGTVLDPGDVKEVEGKLPQALDKQRRELYALLSDRKPRDLVESLEWNDELRDKVRAYCQSYTRALDKAATDPTHRSALLAMDTLTLDITIAGDKPIQAVVVLPFHPLRLSWLSEYDRTLTRWATELAGGSDKARRRAMVDADLVRRVSPANLPFAVPGPAPRGVFVHAREATVGTGIYLAPDEREPGIAVQAVFDVLGIDRRDVATDVPPTMLAERIATYRDTHSHPDAIRLLAINPGSGELLAQALRQAVLKQKEADTDVAELAGRAEVVTYSTRLSSTDPLPALTDLQQAVGRYRTGSTRSYLKPPLGLSVRPFDRLAKDNAPVHLSVVNDLAVVDAVGGSATTDSTASFRNLLTPTSNRPVDTSDGRYWEIRPAVRLREGRDGKNKDGAADAVDAHRAHQATLAVAQGYPAEHGIALRVTVGDREIEALEAAHERADWVLSIDRNLGLEWYSSSTDANRPYILDYAPDFLEGIGPRLTVTTKHQDEIERLLSATMRELSFANDTQSVRSALRFMQMVSGRLALRLIGRSDLAVEAVGLAALLASLESRGELADTIIVPVDVHQEVFGVAAGNTRFCDLILVHATRQTIRLECVEVKLRRGVTPPEQVAEDIVEQLDATVSMLENGFLRSDPPRLDVELQRARLAGILRHHANRAFAMGMLSEGRLAAAERQFARIEDGTNPEITKQGYVINLDSEQDIPGEYRGVAIEVLTPADLRKADIAAVGSPQPVAPQPPTTPSAEPAPEPSAEPVPEPVPKEPPSSSNVVATQPVPPFARPGPSERGEPEPKRPDHPGEIRVMLGRDAHSAEVNWRISTSGSPHMFVLGIPGQGKSVTTRRILNSFADQGLPALVVDFHGDMAADPAANATVVDAADGLDFSPFELRADVDHQKYAQAAWELSEVIGYVSGLGEIQRNVVYEALRELYQRHGFGSAAGPTGLPTMAEFSALLEQMESNGRGRNVAARTRPLSDFGLFRDDAGEGRFGKLLDGGVVLDVHTLMEQVQLAAAAFVLRKVYQEMFHWGKTDELRLAVVLDEAHRLAKDVTLPKIMKEGRKYGMTVVVASQGVDDFHRDVLGNAGTKVAFRCNFPQSKTVAGFLRGRAGQDMALALEKLSVGQAYVSTPDSPEAKRVFMER
ncbi:helicase HerA domain-containing protein [Saccharothrix isguenensis]